MRETAARRSNGGPLSSEVFRAGVLEIRPDDNAAFVDGRPLHLTVRELALLLALADRAGRIVSRADLYELVWRQGYRSCDRSVDVYVSKLRAKLEQALPEWRYIHTHVGFGYRFSPEPLHHFHTLLTDR